MKLVRHNYENKKDEDIIYKNDTENDKMEVQFLFDDEDNPNDKYCLVINRGYKKLSLGISLKKNGEFIYKYSGSMNLTIGITTRLYLEGCNHGDDIPIKKLMFSFTVMMHGLYEYFCNRNGSYKDPYRNNADFSEAKRLLSNEYNAFFPCKYMDDNIDDIFARFEMHNKVWDVYNKRVN